MSMNNPPPAAQPSPRSSQGTQGAVPGRTQHQGNANAAAMQLTMMLGDELIAAGKAIKSGDPRAWAISQTKLRQIQQAAVSIGGQNRPAAGPQPRTGVANPTPRAVDSLTQRG